MGSASSTSTSAGQVDIRWDGRNADGSLLPPGIYLYRLKVDSDDASSERIGTLSLAY